VDPECVGRGGDAEPERGQRPDDEDRPVRDHERQEHDEERRSGDQPDDVSRPATNEPVPGCAEPQGDDRERERGARKRGDRQCDELRDRDQRQDQRGEREEPSSRTDIDAAHAVIQSPALLSSSSWSRYFAVAAVAARTSASARAALMSNSVAR
jgi:hypothetical protein